MNNSQTIPPVTANLYRWLYYALWLTALPSLPIIAFNLTIGIKLVFLAWLMLAAISCLVLSISIYMNTPGRLAVGSSAFGVIVVAGGALFDILATVIHSPDLSMEANPVARLLLGAGFPVKAVYLFGMAGQILLTSIVVLMWLTATKRYRLMVESAPRDNLFATVKLLLAGPDRTLLDVIIGRGDPFYIVTSLAVLLTLSFTYRWYLGLEWFGLVPVSRVVAPTAIMVMSVAIYLGVSMRAYRSEAAKATVQPPS